MSRDVAFEGLRSAPRRWLVTGAAGFIGSHLIEALIALGQDVVGLDNFATGREVNLSEASARAGQPGAGSFRFIRGDVRDFDTCRRACDGRDIVLHQAALGSVPRSIDDPAPTHTTNVDGFFNMLCAARDAKVTQFVFASSSNVYGDSQALPRREDELGNPLSPYAASKRAGELYAGVFARVYSMSCVGLRYFNVFGPRQNPEGAYAAVIPRWVRAALGGETAHVFGDGSATRDFCYVENVVDANLLAGVAAAERGTSSLFNVGCGAQTSLNDLWTMIANEVVVLNPRASVSPLIRESERAGDVRDSLAEIARIREALGYVPRVPVAEGVAATVRWFHARAGKG